MLKRLIYSLKVKIKDVEHNIPSITGLATTAAYTAVENEIPNFSGIVKKVDYVTKKKEIESKYFTTCDYNKFMNDIIEAKVKIKRNL